MDYRALIQRINDLITSDGRGGEMAVGETLHGSEVTLHIDPNNHLVLSVTEEAADTRTWVILGPRMEMT